MGVKRKHIDDASPTSISSFGAVSTPNAQSPIRFPQGLNGTMDMEMDTESTPRSNGWNFMRAHRVKSSDWGNRTRKRVRDNRPDERAIHGRRTMFFNTARDNTVHKLFLAQRQHPHASPIPSDLLPAQPAIVVSKPQKSTLHSFWNISAPPAQAPLFSYHTTQQQDAAQGPRCEDCDARLEVDEGGMDVDMDMDGAGCASVFVCCECGRSVCGTCAVVGDKRHCLQCATHGY
ncbi:hypothetical protein BU25DRAFT_330395 [Macroventuria anomochaeta]|uniref:Uncharacterized protein n=1 Tax=Macroventuria anomochaeta TaxID=301207 RepID=A0ACB6SGV6_9PLEO|nr:uncharacterized protein BU25DRAFT_330395 [Macroventuria anomochaeta]KAF2632815.1 hypothetical protein BU25DRAFT_330395 [Macroventuria anomochaeta]